MAANRQLKTALNSKSTEDQTDAAKRICCGRGNKLPNTVRYKEDIFMNNANTHSIYFIEGFPAFLWCWNCSYGLNGSFEPRRPHSQSWYVLLVDVIC
jgi:hypothetical protein